jgi:hypothetical protein
MGWDAKSYMKKGFLICYEEMHKYFPHGVVSHTVYDFAPDPSEFPNI